MLDIPQRIEECGHDGVKNMCCTLTSVDRVQFRWAGVLLYFALRTINVHSRTTTVKPKRSTLITSMFQKHSSYWIIRVQVNEDSKVVIIFHCWPHCVHQLAVSSSWLLHSENETAVDPRAKFQGPSRTDSTTLRPSRIHFQSMSTIQSQPYIPFTSSVWLVLCDGSGTHLNNPLKTPI